MTPRQRKTAKWTGVVLGGTFGILFAVILPMYANYQSHGSIFIEQGNPND